MRRILLGLLLCLLPTAAIAQQEGGADEADRGFLTALLEDSLSSRGRSVRIEGFRGALSSRATFEELTIADGEGVWITIRDGAIAWNRAALLSGRIEIGEMVAAEIDLPRAPVAAAPGAAAPGFSLPELPVSVEIGALRAERVTLGAALFGARAVVRLDGRMRLAGGEGTAEVSITRTDGPRGVLTLNASYANATRQAMIDLLLDEAADGIAARLLGLPDRPALVLAVHGNGLIDDLVTELSLSTDGVPRLGGSLTLRTTAAPGAKPEHGFALNLRGDIAPLVLPEYRAFFGPDVRLEAEGRRTAAGGLELARLVLGARGLDLGGRLSLSPEGLPVAAALTARLGLAGGDEMLLPLPGPRTWLRAGDLRLRYDAARGEAWTLEGAFGGLRREGLRIAAMTLDGSGRIAPAGRAGVRAARAGGTLRFAATGIAPDDPALAAAVGPALSGRAVFFWQQDGPLHLPVFELAGPGYEARGGATLSEPRAGVTLAGRIAARVEDMGRFSALAGRPLGGTGALEVAGSAGLLSGRFDIEGAVSGRRLSLDQPELDRLLSGDSRIDVSARRDETGVTLRRLALRSATLSADASGRIATGATDLAATFALSDLGALGPAYRGAFAGTARVGEDGAGLRLDLEATGKGLALGQPQIDRVLAGAVSVTLAASRQDGRVRLESFRLTNPQLEVGAESLREAGGRRIAVSARLADMALLAPGFPGPLTAQGAIAETAGGYALDLTGAGPGATQARLRGSLAADLSAASLALVGGGQAAIINPFIAPRNVAGPVTFDLRLEGPLRPASVSGRVALEGGRLVAPTFGVELESVSLGARIAGGSALVSGAARVRGGGEVAISGPVSLAPDPAGDLAIRLSAARLRDPELFDTTVTGTLRLAGPLGGGAAITGDLRLGPTELRLPSAGAGSDPVLRELVHRNEPAEVRRTRERAGLSRAEEAARRRGPPYGLGLTILAPERIFVRGRGLDAELGGTLTLGGTTDAIVPSGRFGLIRGRLDLLGKRFTIDEGSIELQGALTPYIRFAARSAGDGITATIVIEGSARAPEVRFLSAPPLPEEEVIARLLFGRELGSLSPLQAARLAGAVAELSGAGGEGVVSRLRRSFGLDDLDVATDADGSAVLRAGKYLSEKLYTDVNLGARGRSEINLNLDVRPGVVARGTLGSDGSSSVGIYFERDY